MERIFNHPTFLKALSVVLAVMLWAYVMPRYMADTQRSFDVPLTIVPSSNPNFQVLEDLPSTVQVRTEGKNVVVSQLRKEDFKAVLDLSKLTDLGVTTTIEVQLQTVGPYQTQYDKTVSPKTIAVTLVEEQSVTVPLVLDATTGVVNWKDGEYQYTATPESKQVSFSGRNDYVATIQSGSVTLGGGDLNPDNQVITRPVVPLDAAGRPVKVANPKVNINLTWVRLPPGRAYKIRPVTKGTLPQGLVVSAVTATPANITLRANVVNGKLPDLSTIDTLPIDLTGRTQTFTIATKLVVPQGTTPSADTVNVTVTIGEMTAEQVYKGVPITKRGMGETGVQIGLSVTDVQIRLQAPYSVLKSIDPASLTAYVDLEGIGSGKHTLPIKVLLPPGATGAVVDPPTVDVVVTSP
ncbi:MAG: YbbR-like domain-containing protein [Mycobacterium leprae]